jgi:hypothetical protein
MNKKILFGVFALLLISTIFAGISSALSITINTQMPILATNATQA